MESGMNCAERVIHYTENIPHERAGGNAPPSSWSVEGRQTPLYLDACMHPSKSCVRSLTHSLTLTLSLSLSLSLTGGRKRIVRPYHAFFVLEPFYQNSA